MRPRGTGQPAEAGANMLLRLPLLGLLGLLGAPSASEGLDPRIRFPPAYDCAMKRLALATAEQLLQNASQHRHAARWSGAVFDALELGPKCGAARPALSEEPSHAPSDTLEMSDLYRSRLIK